MPGIQSIDNSNKFGKETIMPKTVIGLVNTEAQAATIVQRVKEIGIPTSNVCVQFPDITDSRDFAHEHNTKLPEGSAVGAILISAHAADDDVIDWVKDIMKQVGAEDISKHVTGAFDPTSEAYSWRDNFKARPYSEDAPRFPTNLFTKLPGFAKSPPGRERKVLRLLPRILMLGTLLLGIPSLLARLYPWDGSETLVAMRIASIDIFMISAVILHWSIVCTVAIAAFIVMVMKGPAYVADAYPLEDSDTPDGAKSPNSVKNRNSPR